VAGEQRVVEQSEDGDEEGANGLCFSMNPRRERIRATRAAHVGGETVSVDRTMGGTAQRLDGDIMGARALPGGLARYATVGRTVFVGRSG
jgi:hypothetical protein